MIDGIVELHRISVMDNAKHQRQTNDAHRAIGRYVVEFSGLMYYMRCLMAWRLTVTGGDPQELGELVLGEAWPTAIANAFFGMCRYVSEPDKDEERIASTLRSAVTKAIKKRNDIAHGDWWVGVAFSRDEDIPDPRLVRIHPVRAEGIAKDMSVPVAELDGLSDSLEALLKLVVVFGHLCLELPVLLKEGVSSADLRVRDVLVMDGKQVIQDGPKAELLGRINW